MHALKGVVIIMTLTIAVLMTLIVYGMYQKSQNPDFKFFDFSLSGETQPTTTPQITPPISSGGDSAAPNAHAFGDITLPLPQGAKISSATVSGNRMVIVTTAPKGEQVWVVDLASGQVLGRVKAQ